MDHGEILIDGR